MQHCVSLRYFDHSFSQICVCVGGWFTGLTCWDNVSEVTHRTRLISTFYSLVVVSNKLIILRICNVITVSTVEDSRGLFFWLLDVYRSVLNGRSHLSLLAISNCYTSPGNVLMQPRWKGLFYLSKGHFCMMRSGGWKTKKDWKLSATTVNLKTEFIINSAELRSISWQTPSLQTPPQHFLPLVSTKWVWGGKTVRELWPDRGWNASCHFFSFFFQNKPFCTLGDTVGIISEENSNSEEEEKGYSSKERMREGSTE